MEKGIALSVIYVILALVHGLGLILNSSLLLDLAIPSGKTPLVVCHTLTSITLFSSDVLVLMDLFNNIGVSKLGAVSSYFDFYSGLSFFVIFCNSYDFKSVQLLNKISAKYHAICHRCVSAKSFLQLYSLIICAALPSIHGVPDLSILLALWLLFTCCSNSSYLILLTVILKKLQLQLIHRDKVVPFASGPSEQPQTNGSTQSGKNSQIVKKMDDTEKALLEIDTSIKGGLSLCLLLAVSTTALIIVYYNTSGDYRSGKIVTIPWKIGVGMGMLIIPVVHYLTGQF